MLNNKITSLAAYFPCKVTCYRCVKEWLHIHYLPTSSDVTNLRFGSSGISGYYCQVFLLPFHYSLLELSCLFADTHHLGLHVLEAREHKHHWKAIFNIMLDTQIGHFQSSSFLNCFPNLLLLQRQIVCLLLFK